MSLAFKELRYQGKRYLLMTIIVMLMMFMVLSLSGLVNGLGMAVSSSVENLPVSSFVLSDDAEKLLTVSSLTDDQVKAIKKESTGKTATLDVTRTYITKKNSDEKKDAVYFAVDANSFLAPSVTSGTTLAKSSHSHAVILDQVFKDEGIALGDTIKDASSGVKLYVAGFSKSQMYGHVSVIYMDTATYQTIIKKNKAPVSNTHAIALNSGKLAHKVKGTAVYNKETIIESIPGYRAEQSTITMVIDMLVVITAVILGVFFYVVNLQKEREFGTMKALGVKMSELSCFTITQICSIALCGALIALGLTAGMTMILPSAMPFYFNLTSAVGILCAFVAISLAGGLVTIIHIAHIDPADIIGGEA